MNKTITVYFTTYDLHIINGTDQQEYMEIFIKSTINWENAKIDNRGFVTLNEVIEDLGMDRKFKYIPYGFDTKVDIEYDKERDRGRIIAKKLYFDDPIRPLDDADISMRVMEGK